MNWGCVCAHTFWCDFSPLVIVGDILQFGYLFDVVCFSVCFSCGWTERKVGMIVLPLHFHNSLDWSGCWKAFSRRSNKMSKHLDTFQWNCFFFKVTIILDVTTRWGTFDASSAVGSELSQPSYTCLDLRDLTFLLDLLPITMEFINYWESAFWRAPIILGKRISLAGLLTTSFTMRMAA